jgi:predicted ArsR family transcriptional regulator
LQAVADLAARPADSHPAQATQVTGGGADLPKEAEGVLKVLVKSNELTPEDIAGQVRLSEQKVEYFLDMLKERELADEIMYSGRPSEFVVTSKGRKYLFEHGMLE